MTAIVIIDVKIAVIMAHALITRSLMAVVLERLAERPAVAMLGPRQGGQAPRRVSCAQIPMTPAHGRCPIKDRRCNI